MTTPNIEQVRNLHQNLEDESEFLTTKQAAYKLQVSEQTIRNLYHEGKLRGQRVGKLIRIDRRYIVGTDATQATAQPMRRRGRKIKDYIGGLK